MAHLNAFEFIRAIQDDCDQSDIVISYDIRLLDDTVVKMRVALTSDAFIDVFYNSDSGKCSYALIEKGIRIFDADNAFIGWHIHPFDNPSQHVSSSKVSFEEFLNNVEEHGWD